MTPITSALKTGPPRSKGYRFNLAKVISPRPSVTRPFSKATPVLYRETHLLLSRNRRRIAIIPARSFPLCGRLIVQVERDDDYALNLNWLPVQATGSVPPLPDCRNRSGH
jgi:hypothetical protein